MGFASSLCACLGSDSVRAGPYYYVIQSEMYRKFYPRKHQSGGRRRHTGQFAITCRQQFVHPFDRTLTETDLDARADNIPDHMMQEGIRFATNQDPVSSAIDFDPGDVAHRRSGLASGRTKGRKIVLAQ